MEILNLHVILHKVKAHNNDPWNNRADEEANKGRKDNLILVKNNYSKHKYQLQHFNMNIDMNPRKFIKKMNNVLIQQEFNNLNRNKEFINKSTDDELSLKILKEKYRKKGLSISKFRTFKDHGLKAFAVKKIMNELLTLENLKIRRPDLYKENLNCVRCNEQKEDLDHLWNCRTVTNDILFIGLKSNRFLNKILAGEKKKDDIMDALFKYTKLERELKIFNTRENTEFYCKNKDICIARTYIWNGNNSLDTLLRD